MAELLDQEREAIISSNKKDLEAYKGEDISMFDRLKVNDFKVNEMIAAAKHLASQEDPVGVERFAFKHDNGMQVYNKTASFGTILIIYESRPDVTVEAAGIAFKSGKYRNILLVMVVAPFFTSFLLRTIAWTQILADSGPIVSAIKVLPFVDEMFRINNTSTAVVIGLAYNFLPFMTLPLYASLERIDPRTLEAAGDLYANGFTTFRKVTLPLSMPGVVAGTLLTFIPAAGDYVNAAILGNPGTKMIGNVIESRFFAVVDYPTAAALSFTLMATILILVTLYIRKSGTDELV